MTVSKEHSSHTSKSLSKGMLITFSIFFGLGIILVAGSFGLRNARPKDNILFKTTLDIFQAIGIGFLAGSVTTLTLDRYSRTQLHNDIRELDKTSRNDLCSFINELDKTSRTQLHDDIRELDKTNRDDLCSFINELDEKSRDELHSYVYNSIQQIQQTSGDKLLEGIVGSNLIYNQLSTYIIKKPYILEDFIVDLKFISVADDVSFLQRETCFSYKVKNLSGDEIKYPLQVNFQKPIVEADKDENQTNIRKSLSIKIIRLSNQSSEDETTEKINSTQLEKHIYNEDNDSSYTFKKDITIDKDEQIKCIITFKSFEKNYDRLLLSPLTIADGMELRVDYPHHLQLLASPIHPNKEQFKKESHLAKRHTMIWKIDAGILPYQGIELRWQIT